MQQQTSIREQIKQSTKSKNRRFTIVVMELIIGFVLFSATLITMLLMYITNVLVG